MSETRKENRAAIASKHPWLTITILLVGTFLSLVNETMMNVTFTTLEEEFGISTTTVQWLTVGYVLVVAILIPLTAFLIHSFTTKQLFSVAMTLFLLGCAIAAFTESFPLLMAARIIQACGAGMSVSIVLGAGLALLPPSMHGLSTSICAGIATLGPAFGPVYAGVVLRYLNWQMMFSILMCPTAIVLVLTLLFVENASDLSRPRLDVLSFLESAVGMSLLVFGISFLSSSAVGGILCLILGGLAMIIWYKRQLKLEVPYIDVRLLGIKGFPLVVVAMAFTNMAMLSISVLVPMIYQEGYFVDVFHASLLMLPAGLVLSVFAPIGGRYFDKHGARIIATLGTLFITFALIALGLTSAALPVWFYLICSVFVYLGISLSQSPLQSHIYAKCAPEKKQDAIALTNVGMQLGGSCGTTISVLILTAYRSVFAANANVTLVSMRATFLTIGILFLGNIVSVLALFRRK